MDLPRHQLRRETFAALASGEGGRNAIRELAAAQYSKHAILLAGVLAAAEGNQQYGRVRAGYELLVEATRENRTAAESVIRYPSVGVWAWRTIRACRGGPAIQGAEPAGLCAVAAAAAIRAGMTAELEVPVTDGRVMLPSLGAAVLEGRSARMRASGGHVEVGPVEVPRYPYQDAPGWLGLRKVRAGSFEALIDALDPFRMPDIPYLASHRDSYGWDEPLQRAWLLLEAHHPLVAEEIAAALSCIVPRPVPPGGVASTSSRRAFGAIEMSLPPDPVTGGEILAHEIQHLKLGALQDVVALTLPDDGRRYYAPWRDDPRPLNGLLQGTYAYLGVTGFWRRQRLLADGPRGADTEYERWRAATVIGAETLRSSGHLTDAGLDFVDGMDGTLASWRDDPVPEHARSQARRANESHLARWQSANGPMPGP